MENVELNCKGGGSGRIGSVVECEELNYSDNNQKYVGKRGMKLTS